MATTRKPNIVLVDDHIIFQQGLKSIITIENIANVVGEASNGQEFLNLLSTIKPDLVLMDIDMPTMNGVEATRRALEIYPDLKIIAVTMLGDEEYYNKMIEVGVKGFILKSSGIVEFEKAIQDVILGESYFSNELLRKIIFNYQHRHNQFFTGKVRLTQRELEVLQEICIGLTTPEIASKLFISPKTVKSHRANLLSKTGCKNTPELIIFALKNKLVNKSD